MISKAQDDVLKCLVLSTTYVDTHGYAIYCHRRGKRPDTSTFMKLESENPFDFFLKRLFKVILQ